VDALRSVRLTCPTVTQVRGCLATGAGHSMGRTVLLCTQILTVPHVLRGRHVLCAAETGELLSMCPTLRCSWATILWGVASTAAKQWSTLVPVGVHLE